MRRGLYSLLTVVAVGSALNLVGCGRAEPPDESPPRVRRSTAAIGPYTVPPQSLRAVLHGGEHVRQLDAAANLPLAGFAGSQLHEKPNGDFHFSFPDSIWLLGFETRILDSDDADITSELNCHMAIKAGQRWVSDADGDGRSTKPFRGLHTDGFTRGIHLPRGFGLRYRAGEPIVFQPMVNNTRSTPITARIEATIEYLLADELSEPLTPLSSVFLSVADPLLYHVDPGESVRERTYQFATAGTIHLLATHVHDYAASVELINEARDETVWMALAERAENGNVLRMPTYSDEAGYRIDPGETYRVRVTYDNTTDRPQRAMGGLAVFYAEDGGDA